MIFVSLLLSCLIIFIGNQYYQSKINKTVEIAVQQSKEYLAEKEAEQKRLEAERKAKEKAIYEAHKGEELVYFPMGDSLAVGAFATTEDKRYVSVLSQLIEEKMGYDVNINDSTVKAGTGLKDNGIPNLQKVISSKPDLITIEFGTNDMTKELSNAYSTPKEFKKNLSYVVETLQDKLDNNPKIILVTTWYNTKNSPTYDAIIKEVGKQYNVPVADIYSVWKNRTDTYGPEGTETYQGMSDNWHPNDKGHQEIAGKIFEKAYESLQ